MQEIKSGRNRSERGFFFKYRPGYLSLADGSQWPGLLPDWQSDTYPGEVVFNTGMSGYVESLTDPSYAGQILVLTYPLVGNYGVDPASGESAKIQVRGLVVSQLINKYSHASAELSLEQWLKAQRVPLIAGVDSRALTKHLRSSGTMAGVIAPKAVKLKERTIKTSFVSIKAPVIHRAAGEKKVILVDCGSKGNILSSLVKRGLNVKQVPFDYDYALEAYDGVVLSNGPGDPSDYLKTISITKTALKQNKPVFGICLGSQIMALAAGAKTYKLKFGHRGHNQPCLDQITKRAYITSQNHGYAVDEKSLPAGWRVTFKNLNDGSVEGIAHRSKPFFAVQFHPEACPGPTDSDWLFESFVKSLG